MSNVIELPNRDQFKRKVASSKDCNHEGGGFEHVLSCGHVVWTMIKVSDIYCSQCLHDFIDRKKK